MGKILLNCMMCVTMLMGGNYMKQQTIQQYLVNYNKAEVIINNISYDIENDNKLNKVLNEMLTNSRRMPAFGVSIHIDIINSMRRGTWLKLKYAETQWLDEMNFDELLIRVEPDYNGFNIIRGNKGIYRGRCYYIDLYDRTMDELYKFLHEFNITKNT